MLGTRRWKKRNGYAPVFTTGIYEYLMAKYPGPGIDADEFFASE
jgi:hypothetical protein